MRKCNAHVRRYLREVRGVLPCFGRERRRILGQIKATMEDYLAEHPDADYAQITGRFGLPQQIAASYVDEKDTGDLLRALRIRRKIIRIAVATVGLLATIWVGYLTVCYFEVKDSANGYLVVGEIVEETNGEGEK